MSSLPLNDIVNISVNVSPAAVVRNGYNMGLVVGRSTVISPTNRVKIYSSLEEMVAAGFQTDSDEYQMASRYFGQNPRPSKIAVGVIGEGETPLDAITDCRQKNADWYICTLSGVNTGGINPEHVTAISQYIESCTPLSVLFYAIMDTQTLTSVMEPLKTAKRKRSLGIYSTNDAYAAAAVMGYAMGMNTQGQPSFDLAYKSFAGIYPDALTQTDMQNILNANGNVYIQQGSYEVFRQGIMADGTHFDEVFGLDILVNDIQTGVMNALTSLPKIPQTEGGVGVIKSSITSALNNSAARDFIAPGVWNAPPVLGLNTGDTLPAGFLVQSESIDSQSETDRAARKAPPIYVCIKLAGAIEYVTVTLNVNR